MDFSATSGAQWKINLALKMVLPFCPQLLDGNLPTSGISCLIRASLFTWGSWVTPHVCCCCCCLVDQSCHTLCDPMDCSPPGASVHEISQARIPGQGATSFCRGPSRPRDWTRNSCVSCTGVSSLPSAPPGRPWCHSVCPRTRRAAGGGRFGPPGGSADEDQSGGWSALSTWPRPEESWTKAWVSFRGCNTPFILPRVSTGRRTHCPHDTSAKDNRKLCSSLFLFLPRMALSLVDFNLLLLIVINCTCEWVCQLCWVLWILL